MIVANYIIGIGVEYSDGIDCPCLCVIPKSALTTLEKTEWSILRLECPPIP